MVEKSIANATECACNLAQFIQHLYDSRELIILSSISFSIGMMVGYGLGVYF